MQKVYSPERGLSESGQGRLSPPLTEMDKPVSDQYKKGLVVTPILSPYAEIAWLYLTLERLRLGVHSRSDACKMARWVTDNHVFDDLVDAWRLTIPPFHHLRDVNTDVKLLSIYSSDEAGSC